MLTLTLSDPWFDQIHVRLTLYSVQLEDSLERVEMMFGYAAHTHALTLHAAPGLAKLGSTISVNLQDSGDSIFEDIATSRRDRKRDYQPRKADLVQTTFETPGEQNEYNWSQLDSQAQIRLVKITASPGTRNSAVDRNVVERNVIASHCPKRDLLCEIIHGDIGSLPKYEAVSYTWRDYQREIPLQTTDHRFIRINASLYACLQRLMADTDERLLWVDQICIDQSKTEEGAREKGSQVRIMHKIFQNATRTFVWLEEEDEDAQLALRALNLLPAVQRPLLGIFGAFASMTSQIPGNIDEGQSETESDVYRKHCAIGKLLNRRWFERAWIYQEAALSPRVDIVVGSSRLDFMHFSSAVLAYCESEQEKIRQYDESLVRITKGYNTLLLINARRRKNAANPTNKGLLALLCRLAGTVLAIDDRDLVYSFLAFQDLDRPAIIPDYSPSVSVSQAYNSAAKSLVEATCDLHILGVTGGHRREDLASWAPDWAVRLPQGQPICGIQTRTAFSASRGRQHTLAQRPTIPYSLFVSGRIIDTVAGVTDTDFDLNERNKGGISRFLQMEKHLAALPTDMQDKDKSILLKRLLKTMLADDAFAQDDNLDQQEQLTEKELCNYLDMYRDETSVRANSAWLPELDKLKVLRQRFREKMLISYRKRVFHTEKRHLGLAPKDVSVGDQLVVLHGSKVPCVLRKAPEEDWYRVIGQCYHEGAMYGEMCDWEESEATVFELR